MLRTVTMLGSATALTVALCAVPMTATASVKTQATDASGSAPGLPSEGNACKRRLTGTWVFFAGGNRGYMDLKVTGQGGYIRGTYRTADGVTSGEIWGYLDGSCRQGSPVWAGRYDDGNTSPYNAGPQRAVFNLDEMTFKGWFKTHDDCSAAANLIKQCKFKYHGRKS